MFLGDHRAEKSNRANILDRLWIDNGRNEALPRVPEYEQFAIVHRQGSEETRLCVADRLEIAGGQFVAEDVRHTGVVRTPEQILTIFRKNESFRHPLPEVKRRHRCHVVVQQRLDLHHTQGLITVDLAEGCGQQSPVGRDIHVIDHLAIRKAVDLVPPGIGMWDSHECRDAVHVAYSPDRFVGPVEYELPNPRVSEKHA